MSVNGNTRMLGKIVKRKVDFDCRMFKERRNFDYFVIESSGKALWLICNETMAVLK